MPDFETRTPQQQDRPNKLRTLLISNRFRTLLLGGGILLVVGGILLVVVAIPLGLFGNSVPDQGEQEGGGELKSAIPVGSEQLKSTTPVGPGQQLAFGIRGRGYDLYAIDPAGSKPTRLTDGVDPAWSPDGEQIAYTKYLKEPNEPNPEAPSSASATPEPFIETPSIFVMNTDGSGGKQLLDKAAGQPVWSPDGKEIAFTLNNPGYYKGIGYIYCGIYVINADGSGMPRKLATGPGCASSPAWSPDGKKIAYTNGLGSDELAREKTEIYVAYAPGWEDHTKEPEAITDSAPGTAVGDPSWSPDGKELAYTYSDQEGKTSIYKMGADGSGQSPIARYQHLKKLEAASCCMDVVDGKFSPAWSPDGDQIAYVRSVPYCDPDCGGGYSTYAREIYIMNSDGSDPTLVRDFEIGFNVWGLDWGLLP
jgi:Tol biopolymer transport system component